MEMLPHALELVSKPGPTRASYSKSSDRGTVVDRAILGQSVIFSLVVTDRFVLGRACDSSIALLITNEWLQVVRFEQCLRNGRRIVIINEAHVSLGGCKNKRNAVQCEKELRLSSTVCQTNVKRCS